MNKNLMITSDGNLFNTSKPNWYKLPPLREKYCYHFREIKTVAQLKATLRNGSTTGFGGYPLYFITSDGAALSFDSAIKNFKNIVDSIKNNHSDGWRVVACDVNWENDDLYCDHNNQKIDSAYGGF